MINTFVSEGLGLFNRSLSTHSPANQLNANQSNERIFVNAATGNVVVHNIDESIKALGNGLSLPRTYNSLGEVDGSHQELWRLGIVSSVYLEGEANQAGSRVFRLNHDGYKQTFTFNTSENRYESAEGQGAHDVIKWDSNNNTATFMKDGHASKDVFAYQSNNSLLLTETVSENGHKTVFNYSGNKLSRVDVTTETGLQSTLFKYNAQNLLDRVESLSDKSESRTRVYYHYDDQGRLSETKVDLTPEDSSIVDNRVYVTSYTYHGASQQIKTISQTDDTTLSLDYFDDNRIKRIEDGEGNTTHYEYISEHHTRITIGGAQFDYHFDADDKLKRIEYVENAQLISKQYDYYDNGQLKSITDGLANTVQFSYDAKGNLIRQTDQEGRTIERVYDELNQLLVETAAGESSRFVYQANQLRFALAADGSVTEYRYNALGQRESQHQYTSSDFDVSQLSVDSSPTLVQMQSWVLNLSDISAQQITHYDYDFRGQLTSIKTYSGSLGGEGSGDVSETKYVYDAYGQLLHERTANNVANQNNAFSKSYQYDGLGRLVNESSNTGENTHYVFLDSEQKVVTQFANGLWQTKTHNKAGLVVSVANGKSSAETAFGTKVFVRDIAGRIVSEQLESGARSFNFYDVMNNVIAHVDVNGTITRNQFDTAGNLTKSIQYATGINTQEWLKAGKLNFSIVELDEWIANNSITEQDRAEHHHYNKAGQKLFSIDGENYVSKYEYDDKGRLKKVTQFNDPASDLELTNLIQMNGEARTEQFFYSRKGNIEYTINSDGYLTRNYYDKAGNKIAQRQYFEKGTPRNKTEHVNDQVEHWLYDKKGNVEVHIDVFGKVTHFSYDNNGNKTAINEYAHKIEGHQIGSLIRLPSGEKRQTRFEYNEHNQLIMFIIFCD